jgi:DNA (cytosine-5)-methyltransferase 1
MSAHATQTFWHQNIKANFGSIELMQSMRSNGVETESVAAVTHYLQSIGTPQQRHYLNILRQLLPSSVMSRVAESAAQVAAPFPPPKVTRFTFIDLFAGIGGFRLAMQRSGGRCVFSSEWDNPARQTYFANFGEVPFGDITQIANETRFSSEIPKHDILAGGFPCQAFSIAGFKGGFADTRGTLFFNLARVIEDHGPKAFFLENVKGLAGHDKGRTLETILRTLEEDLGYHVQVQVVNAKDFGVPQNRERVFIVGFKSRAAAARFEFPKPLGRVATIADIKEAEVVSTKYYLSDRYLETLIRHRDRHASKGNGFGFEIKKDSDIASAIVVGGMGRERNLVVDKRLRDFTPKTNIKGPVNRQGIRKMTPREWARLQGFPDTFVIPVADAQAYKQFGNSVSVPAIEATVKRIVKALGL